MKDIQDLLREYEDMFPNRFSEMKGIKKEIDILLATELIFPMDEAAWICPIVI